MIKLNQNAAIKLMGAIAATAFVGVSAILPQGAFAQSQQQSPGATGDPRVDEPNTNTQTNDPARPLNNQSSPLQPPNAMPNRGNTTPSDSMNNPRGEVNNTGTGGGAGGVGNIVDTSRPEQPRNRIEKYTQPGATDSSRSTEYLPPYAGDYNSDEVNSTGTGGGGGGGMSDPDRSSSQQPNNTIERYTQPGATDPNRSSQNTTPSSVDAQNRGNDRYTSPNSAPGRGTYTTPSSQINDSGVGGGAGGNVDNRINNSTSPGSATPGSGSTNYNNNTTTPGATTPDSGTTNNNTTSPNSTPNSGTTNSNDGSNTGGGAGGTGAVQGLW
ncbi:MAG: hypothetical protein NW224_09790 [Leptolyngbyaceae cyanobacterium bins.302]|nr:hypothetical protein [Leptolyngbyaceae cyanobacterium bins.302]